MEVPSIQSRRWQIKLDFSGFYRIFLKDNIQRAALTNLDRVGERPDGSKMEVWGRGRKKTAVRCWKHVNDSGFDVRAIDNVKVGMLWLCG